MRKYLVPVLIVTGLLCLALTGCIGGYVVGRGPEVNQSFDITDFRNIEIGSAFGFEITRSDSFSVTVSAHENIFEYLDIKKSNDTLIIRMKPGHYTNSETRAFVSLPELDSLSVSGASRGSVAGFKSTRLLDIEVSGASQLDMNMESGRSKINMSGASKLTGSLKSQDLYLEISGASRCELEGAASTGDVEISGASNLYATAFKLADCKISVSGASNGRIYATETLSIEASGASKVEYSGSPRIKNLNISGASKVENKTD